MALNHTSGGSGLVCVVCRKSFHAVKLGPDSRYYCDKHFPTAEQVRITELEHELLRLTIELQRLKDSIQGADGLAGKDVGPDGFVTGYHFPAGNWQRLLAQAQGITPNWVQTPIDDPGAEPVGDPQPASTPETDPKPTQESPMA